MSSGYVYDPIYLEHDLPGHPESSERLRVLWTRLEGSELLAQLTPLPARPVELDLLSRVHTATYIEQVRRMAEAGGGHLDLDTYLNARSYDAALMAAGGLVEATRAVLSGAVRNAFGLVRPPGHHARPARGMGFCLFNNIAVAARYALDEGGLQRVLIVDFDVHHGNGTQEMFYDTDQVLFFSTHQYPHYPGTGHWRETGAGTGEGYTVNVPLPHGAGDGAFQAIFRELLHPLAARYRPQLILVSAGFDAHWSDPLAALNLSLAGYAWMCRFLVGLAGELCEGRLVFTLEGGYHLNVLVHAVANAFCAMLGLGEETLTDPFGPSARDETPIDEILERIKAEHGLA